MTLSNRFPLPSSRDRWRISYFRAATLSDSRFGFQAVEYQTERLLTQERLLSTIALAYGVLGAVLGALGLYALLAHSVARRTREMGLRMALGATRSAIQMLVVREGIVLVTIGAAAGIPLAVGCGIGVRALLFHTSPFDPRIVGVTALISFIVALTSALIPATRAAHTDPTVSLRNQ